MFLTDQYYCQVNVHTAGVSDNTHSNVLPISSYHNCPQCVFVGVSLNNSLDHLLYIFSCFVGVVLQVGVTMSQTMLHPDLLESCVRDNLNKSATR